MKKAGSARIDREQASAIRQRIADLYGYKARNTALDVVRPKTTPEVRAARILLRKFDDKCDRARVARGPTARARRSRAPSSCRQRTVPIRRRRHWPRAVVAVAVAVIDVRVDVVSGPQSACSREEGRASQRGRL